MPQIPVQSPLRRAARRWLRSAGFALASILLVTCSSDSPVGPGRPGIASLRVAPVFDAYARVAPLTLDNVRVIVVRPAADTLANVAKPFSATASQLQLSVPVFLQSVTEDLLVTLELYSGSTLLFSGTSTVRVSQGVPTPPGTVPVSYQGPGSQVASLSISPRDTTISFGAKVPFAVTALDANSLPVTQYYVSWSTVGAPTGTTVDGAGALTAPASRDTFFLKVVTPTGVADSTQVFIAAAASALVKSAGDAQTGVIGSRLAQPLAVQVNGSDGLPVAGTVVSFAVTTGGGSVDSATATADAQGIARTGVVLGNTVGAQTFTASAPGLTPVVFTATATGSAGIVTWTGATDGAWTTAGNWSPAVVPGVGDSVVIPAGTPNDPTLTGTGSIGALTLLGSNSFMVLAGNLTVARGIAIPDSNAFLELTSGQLSAATVTIAGFQAYLDAFSGGLSVSGAATITGDRAFIDASGPGTNGFGPITLTGAQAFINQRGGTSGAIAISGNSAFWQVDGNITVTGSPALQLTGSTSFVTTGSGLASNVTFNGDVLLGGTGGFLAQGSSGSRVTINGNLTTSGSGTLHQTFANDTVVVSGNATFGGGDESTFLTAGGLFVGGNLTQTGAGTSFVGSGSHTVFLSGSGPQTVNFAAPGFSAGRFQNVIVANTSGAINITSDLYASGIVGVTATAPRVLSGNGSTLFSTILNVHNFTFNNLLLNFAGSTVVTFDSVTFSGYPATANVVTISHPGAAAALPFSTVKFLTTPTSGKFLNVTDNNPSDGVPLVIDMINPTPAAPGGFVTVSGGATVTWPAGSPLHTWTGAVDNSWENPANWTNGGGPGVTGDADIPAGTPNSPVLSSSHQINSLTVQSGASVNMAGFTLTLGGDLLAPSGAAGFTGGGSLFLLGAASRVAGNMGGLTLDVGGDYTVNGRTVVGALSVSNTGNLTLGGQTIVVTGAVTTSATGVLTMTNPIDSILASGAGTFGGGDETGKLTAGYLKLGGSFGQSSANSGASFAASGTHRTEMGAGAVRVINFATPGAVVGTSHFNDLIVNGAAGGINIAANTFVNGQLISHPTGATPVIGVVAAAKVLTVGGVDISALGIDQNVMAIGSGTITQFDNVAFTGQANGVTQLSINNPGTAAPLTFTGLSFAVAPSTGRYLIATDADGVTPNVLTINMATASPSAPSPSLFTAVNGAVINWPAIAPAITWTGAVSTAFGTAGNWSGGVVPTALDDAVIAPAANQPTVSVNATVKNLTVQSGATLSIGNGIQLTANGSFTLAGTTVCPILNCNLTVNGAITTQAGSTLNVAVLGIGSTLNVAGSYAVSNNSLFFGSGQLIPANLPYTGLSISGTASLTGRTSAGANAVNVFGAGNLTLAGHTLVAGLVQVGSAAGDVAVITMTNPLDSIITTNMTFNAGSEAGKLTTGVIVVSGNFSALSLNSPQAFAPSGNHKTVFTNATVKNIVIQPTGANSHFQDLDVSAAAGIALLSNVTATGQLISTPAGAAPVLQGTGVTLTAGGANITRLTIDTLPLILSGGTITAFDHVTFTHQSPTATQLTVSNVGQPSPFVFDSIVFQSAPVAGGFYLSAVDLDGGTPDALTIDMPQATPSTPGAFTQVTNGAVIHWPTTAPTITWTGAVSTDWSVAGNWSPAQVPTSANPVVIPAFLPVATVTSTCAAKTLTTNGQMSLGANTCQVSGSVISNGVIVGTTGAIQILAAGTINGNFPGLVINAPVTVVGATGLGGGNGDITISGAGASLTMNGQTLVSSGTLSVQGGGVLIMNNPADILSVGAAAFDGGNETGLLTAGTLNVFGDFAQAATSSGASFFASGNHLTTIGGANRTIAFATPSTSRFQELDISGGSGVYTLGSDFTVAGQLISIPNNADGPALTGVGRVVTAGGADVGTTGSFRSVTFDGARLVLSGGAIGGFDRVTFVNGNPTLIGLTVNNVGGPSAFAFTNLVFNYGLTAGGFYIQANDLDGASPNPLTLDVIGATPPTGGGGFQANNGAIINWPPTGSTITWTGAVDQDWNNAGNWSPAVVPSVIDNVVLVPITNQPQLTSNVAIHDLTSQASSILDVGGFVLVVGGNVDLAGTITGAAGSGVTLVGTGTLLRGTINTLVAVVGSYILNGNFNMTGDLSVNGSLDLAAFNATVNGNFLTNGTGVLVMTTSGGFLDISGSAIFAGGNTNGLLTQGTIRIGGDFNQVSTTSAQSFAASPGHLTEFSANPVNFFFQTPGATQSHFGDLSETGFGAQFVLQTDMTILGFLSGGDGFGGSFLGNSCPNTLTVTQWNNSVRLDCVQLVIDDPAGITSGMSGVTFQNLPTNVTQLTIRHPGVAAGSWQTFGNLDFVPLSGGDTGHYIDATDLDGGAPFLAVDVFNSTALNGPAFTTTSGGASVLWPNATITWTGAVDNNWFLPGNWDLGFFPRNTNNVIIPAGPANQPSLIGTANVASLNVAGSLVLNGNTVNVSGDFATSGNGTITMNSAFSLMTVGGNANFSGGSTDGLLTAGQLIVAGNFTQSAITSQTSFAPSGTHTTSVGGSALTTIDFGSPGSGTGGSHFQNLDLSNATGGVTLTVNSIVDGLFSNSTSGVTIHGGGASLTARGWSVSTLNVDDATMILDDGGSAGLTTFDNVTFTGFPQTGATQLIVRAVGGAAAARTLTFNNTVFTHLSTVGAGAFYISLEPSIFTLNVVLQNSSEGATAGGNGPSFTQVIGNGAVNWP